MGENNDLRKTVKEPSMELRITKSQSSWKENISGIESWTE
jgi:hypothetical protein